MDYTLLYYLCLDGKWYHEDNFEHHVSLGKHLSKLRPIVQMIWYPETGHSETHDLINGRRWSLGPATLNEAKKFTYSVMYDE